MGIIEGVFRPIWRKTIIVGISDRKLERVELQAILFGMLSNVPEPGLAFVWGKFVGPPGPEHFVPW